MAEISADNVVAVSVQPDKQLLLVRQIAISEDGSVRGVLQFNRLYPPGSDMSAFDDGTQSVASAIWTQDVIDAWRASAMVSDGESE